MKSWLSRKFGGGVDREESEEYRTNMNSNANSGLGIVNSYFDPGSLNLGNQA